MSFYHPVSKWSNLYALGELELGGGYGHSFTNTNPVECLQWDGVVVMDGVRGGSNGAILCRFDKRASNTAYDRHVDKAMTQTRWLQLKRVLKLNNNMESKKRGDEDYDPAYKYDYIFKTIVHNMNAITHKGSLDLCGDETTCGHQGHGEPGVVICSSFRSHWNQISHEWW